MERFLLLLLLLSFMTSLAALGTRTHQHPAGLVNGKRSFTGLGEGAQLAGCRATGSRCRPAGSQRRPVGPAQPGQPTVTAPRSQLTVTAPRQQRFPPNSQEFSFDLCPEARKVLYPFQKLFFNTSCCNSGYSRSPYKVRSLFECCRVSGRGDALDAAEPGAPGGAARPPNMEQAAEIWKENEKSNGNNLVFLQALVGHLREEGENVGFEVERCFISSSIRRRRPVPSRPGPSSGSCSGRRVPVPAPALPAAPRQ